MDRFSFRALPLGPARPPAREHALEIVECRFNLKPGLKVHARHAA